MRLQKVQQGECNKIIYTKDKGVNSLTKVFELLGKIVVDNDGALRAFDDTSDKAEKSEGRMSAALKKIAAAVATAFAVDKIVSFGKACIDLTASFEDSMLKVQSLSGATQEEYDALTEAAQKYGASTAWTAKDVADAMGYMALAGFDTNEILASTSGMLSLASASGEDLATVTDILTDSMTGFGDTAADAGRYADVLATVQAKTNTTVGMLGEAFKYVAPLAGAYGYELEDVSTALGMMANAGVKGSIAGTAMSSIMSRLATDAGATSKSLGALGTLTEVCGVEFYDANGNCRNLSDVLVELCEATKDYSVEQKAEIAKTIAGQEAQKGLLAILNQGADAYMELNETIREVGDSTESEAQNMAETMESGMGGAFRSLQSAWEGFKIAVGKKLQVAAEPIVRRLSKFIQDTAIPAIEKFVVFLGKMKEVIVDIAKWFKEIYDYTATLLKPAIDTLGDTFEKIAEKIRPFIETLKEYFTNGEATTDITNTIKTAIEYLVAAITLVIDAFAAVVNWCLEHTETIENIAIVVGSFAAAWGLVNAAILIWNTIAYIAAAATTALGAAVAFLTSPIGIVIVAIGALIAIVVLVIKYWDELKAGAIKCWNGIKETYSKVVDWVSDNIIAPVVNFFKGLWDSMTEGAKRSWQGIKDVFSKVGEFFKGIFKTIKSIFTTIGDEIGGAVSTAFKTAVNWVLEKAIGIVNGFISAINAVIGVINDIPGVEIKKLKKLEVPEMAEGGVLRKGKVGFLEGDGDEAVVPLEKNTGWIDKLAEKLNARTGGSDELENKLDEVIEAVKGLKIYLDTGAVVGGIAPKMNAQLGRIYAGAERGR